MGTKPKYKFKNGIADTFRILFLILMSPLLVIALINMCLFTAWDWLNE